MAGGGSQTYVTGSDVGLTIDCLNVLHCIIEPCCNYTLRIPPLINQRYPAKLPIATVIDLHCYAFVSQYLLYVFDVSRFM